MTRRAIVGGSLATIAALALSTAVAFSATGVLAGAPDHSDVPAIATERPLDETATVAPPPAGSDLAVPAPTDDRAESAAPPASPSAPEQAAVQPEPHAAPDSDDDRDDDDEDEDEEREVIKPEVRDDGDDGGEGDDD